MCQVMQKDEMFATSTPTEAGSESKAMKLRGLELLGLLETLWAQGPLRVAKPMNNSLELHVYGMSMTRDRWKSKRFTCMCFRMRRRIAKS